MRTCHLVTLHFEDGARGDGDLAANGSILDPGGLGVWLNEPPAATADTATTDEDSAATIPVLAYDGDPDGDPIAIALNTSATFGTVTERRQDG
jgi:hypothetical protein